MSLTDKVKQAKKVTFGTARLVVGHNRLSRAMNDGVTASQLRSIFDDLSGMSDAQIEGFVEIGNQLVNGEINIPKNAFGEPSKGSTGKA